MIGNFIYFITSQIKITHVYCGTLQEQQQELFIIEELNALSNAVKNECFASEDMTDRCFLWSHTSMIFQKWYRKTVEIFPNQSVREHSRADGMCQHSDAPLSRKSQGVI